ncbi:hypothetical protein V8E36_001757 [Tilletia maclaganii]
MSKSKQKRKQQGQQLQAAKKAKTEHRHHPPVLSSTVGAEAQLTAAAAFEEPSLLSTVVPEEDLEITVDTLRALVDNPGLIKSKACKHLRTAVFEFRKACTTGFNAAAAAVADNASLTSRISGALADGGYTEARVLLAEMRIRRQTPKLGALCRWVRDLDVISGLAEQREGRRGQQQRTEAAQAETLQVLDAILRVTGPVDHSPFPEEAAAAAGTLSVRPAWDLRDPTRPRTMLYDAVLDGTLLASSSLPPGGAAALLSSHFRVIQTVPGPERNPPNKHPATVYASRDGAIVLAPPSSAPTTTHHTHPTVPNLHLLRDVLTPDECGRIVGAAEGIGFAPDAPVRPGGGAGAGADAENSVLAHNFYWVVDEGFCGTLWGRVAPFVPGRVGGRKVRGLNRRFRVYRYVPGAEYRAHIDGAWPPSGINPEDDDSYQYDASPPGARQSSLFTFLVYLNDEFAGGETTFFLPSSREGVLNAYPVRPIQGSVVMFPNGETEGSLLHEGTGVMMRMGGRPTAKYVIRTDVEYDVDPGRD